VVLLAVVVVIRMAKKERSDSAQNFHGEKERREEKFQRSAIEGGTCQEAALLSTTLANPSLVRGAHLEVADAAAAVVGRVFPRGLEEKSGGRNGKPRREKHALASKEGIFFPLELKGCKDVVRTNKEMKEGIHSAFSPPLHFDMSHLERILGDT